MIGAGESIVLFEIHYRYPDHASLQALYTEMAGLQEWADEQWDEAPTPETTEKINQHMVDEFDRGIFPKIPTYSSGRRVQFLATPEIFTAILERLTDLDEQDGKKDGVIDDHLFRTIVTLPTSVELTGTDGPPIEYKCRKAADNAEMSAYWLWDEGDLRDPNTKDQAEGSILAEYTSRGCPIPPR